MPTDYIYADARIRNLETALLTAQDMEQLLSLPTAADVLEQLAEHGWGGADGTRMSAEQLLKAEENEAWAEADDLVKDPDALDVLRVPKDYHNLKAALKQEFTGTKLAGERLYVTGGKIPVETIRHAAEEKNWSLLPERMATAASEAWEVLSHVGDGQLCDEILDRASLEALQEAGEASKETALQEYASVTAAAADVRMALRGARAGRSREELMKALVPCRELDPGTLAGAAIEGPDRVAEYLSKTDYAPLGTALGQSVSAFERSCDDLLTERLKPQKSECFTLGPIAAYVLARENEIKCVRIILTGKQNRLPDAALRESLRETYV